MSEETKRIAQLKKSRASMKAKLTHFQTFLNTAKSYDTLSDLHATELECRLSVIEKLHSDFDVLQVELELLCDTQDDQYADRLAFENQYFSLLAAARLHLATCSDKFAGARRDRSGSVASFNDANSGGTCKCHNNSHNISLPKINMGTFDGSYHNWLEFRDTFLSLIHSNDKLDNISKFHYLRASLKGTATNMVKNIDFTGDNYIIAWNLLMERFNNPRLLVNNHVQALFKVEPIQKESSISIRFLLDTFNKNIRALTTLKQPTEHWDTLLIYMMSIKLDLITNRHWEEYRNTLSAPPTFSQLCAFLSNRADLLDTLEDVRTIPSRQEVKSNKSYLVVSNNQNNKSKHNINNCSLCTNKNHALYNCDKFRSFSVDKRIEKVNDLKVCMNCLRHGHSHTKCPLTHCRYCKQKHNTLLHTDSHDAKFSSTTENVAFPINTSQSQSNHDQVVLSSNTSQHGNAPHVFLSTALVRVDDASGKPHKARILLDNGSTANFVTEELCDKLGLRQQGTRSTVSGICNQASISSQSCNLTIKSIYTDFKVNLHCLTLPKITKALPSKYVDINHVSIPSGIQLADPTFNVPSAIDILVGADTFWNVICNNSIDLGINKPKLYETKLGWLVSGHVNISNRSSTQLCHFLDNSDDISRFWELDSISSAHSLSFEERACEEHFFKNTYRNDEGRFVVTMPLKRNLSELGDSYIMAKNRFLSLERRFQRNSQFKSLYCNFMQDYENLGHMTCNTKSTTQSQSHNEIKYFVPHHGVIRKTNDSISLRTVFDASAATTTRVSLNNLQMVGPTVQDELLSILIRFRQHKIVVVADIEKMYRAIQLNPNQRSLQQIIFRYDTSEPLRSYTLNTLTYGMACAPYLATKCLTSLANDVNNDNVKYALAHCFYVDDYLNGAETEQEVVDTCRRLIQTLSSAKFNLRKFQSNCPAVLNKLFELNSDSIKDLSSTQNSKTLGLQWNPVSDNFSFAINIQTNEKVTKRHILSVISQVFDPLGLVGPTIVIAKLIMQVLWLLKLDWDVEVPSEIKTQWISFLRKLNQLNEISIPRWVLQNKSQTIELHIFSDSSEKIYAACVYARSVSEDGSVHTQLIASRNKVAPLKPVTIPRLELCGALLSARLCAKVLGSITIPVKCRFWCDSTIVLGWLSANTANLKQFVRNRVNEINETTAGSPWSYVPSQVNPADLLTRPGKADLVSAGAAALWWSGPPFLKHNETSWPTKPGSGESEALPDVLCHISNSDTNTNINITSIVSILIHKMSNFNRLIRVLAYVRRFIHNCQNKQCKLISYLTSDELRSSHDCILQQAQSEMFPLEHSCLTSNKTLPHKNRLISLSPFLDPSDKLIRVGGRLDNSPYSYDQKHQILLCSKHPLANLIFQSRHINLLHAGPSLLLANVRQTYWPLGGRSLARRTTHNCITCFRFKAKNIQPIMGQLPERRTTLESPFLHCSVDYAGPVMIADRKGRGCKLIKSYLCIFVCLAVKAVHLELVTDLTKEGYMAALHRFVSRRGKPQSITSDNACCFVGARNDIASLISNVGAEVENEGIRFYFSPAYSPHFNGVAEAAVKQCKHHLRRVLNLTNLTYEELSTCLAQIEAILNSRPLIPLTHDPSDLSALTPAHFLVGRALTSVPQPQIPVTTRISLLQRHKRVALIAKHFWSRFRTEYVSLLQNRSKWRDSRNEELREGALVLLRDKTRPPLLWPLGRVLAVHPGQDGVGRVAEIRTSRGTLLRGWNNICPLPLDL